MKMIELLGGLLLGGVAGATLKDRILGTNVQNKNINNEVNQLYEENVKLSRRNKELERQVEDLLMDLKKARQKAKDSDDDHDDIEDELDRVKKDLKACRSQNEELARKVKEYKTVCEAQEAEISMLKEKLG